jgi:hypothetical protein
MRAGSDEIMEGHWLPHLQKVLKVFQVRHPQCADFSQKLITIFKN